MKALSKAIYHMKALQVTLTNKKPMHSTNSFPSVSIHLSNQSPQFHHWDKQHCILRKVSIKEGRRVREEEGGRESLISIPNGYIIDKTLLMGY